MVPFFRASFWLEGVKNYTTHFVLSGGMRKWDMMYGICAIWKTPVEVRRNGVGAFLMQLFGHKKSLQDWKSTPCRLFRAEREGFEPPEPRSSTVFKTAAIDHSAISPTTKVRRFFILSKFFKNFFAIFFYFFCNVLIISVKNNSLKIWRIIFLC